MKTLKCEITDYEIMTHKISPTQQLVLVGHCFSSDFKIEGDKLTWKFIPINSTPIPIELDISKLREIEI